MPAVSKSLKASEKQAILKKLVTEMKKRYGGGLPKHPPRSSFETLLFSICLEDSSHQDAEEACSRLIDSFFDLNEIRVSFVSEIERVLGDLENADWKALRIRESLQHVFEKYYAFDLESLKRKTQDAALKELEEIPHQTSFMRSYTVQQVLGAHVLPIDESMNRGLIWLGLADPEATPEATAEDLKSAVKKSDGPLLCHLIKCLSIDPELRSAFETLKPEESFDPVTAPEHLAELFRTGGKKKKPTRKAKKAVSRKKPAPKTTSRNPAKKKAASSVKKVTKKKPAGKKAARKRTK
jgi:endonuclease III